MSEFAHAIIKGDIELVKLLLSDPRVDPSADNNFAIKKAAENGHYKIVKLLLNDPRVDPSVEVFNSLLNALAKSHLPHKVERAYEVYA